MDLANRIAIIGLLLLWVVFWIVVILMAILLPGQTVAAIKGFASLLETNNTLYGQIMVSLLAGALLLVSALLLLLELAPRQAKGVHLTQVKGGEALMTTEAIVERIRHEVEKLPGIQQAKPTVIPRQKAVEVQLDLCLDPEVNDAAKAEEVCRVVADCLANRTGIKLHAPPRVFLRHGPLGSPKSLAKPSASPMPAPSSGSEERQKAVSSGEILISDNLMQASVRPEKAEEQGEGANDLRSGKG